MKPLILILNLLFTFSYATTNQQLQMQINKIKQEQIHLNNTVDKLDNFTQKAFNTANEIANQSSSLISQSSSDISNKLSSIQFLIFIGGVVYGIFGFLIEYKRRKIEGTLKKIKATSDEIDRKKQDLENFIKNNETELYNKLMQRDVDSILGYLELYPELIHMQLPILNFKNLGYTSVNWEIFKRIVAKYQKFNHTDINAEMSYLFITVEHF